MKWLKWLRRVFDVKRHAIRVARDKLLSCAAVYGGARKKCDELMAPPDKLMWDNPKDYAKQSREAQLFANDALTAAVKASQDLMEAADNYYKESRDVA